MQTIPLQPVPAQIVLVPLDGQQCTIEVYQRWFGVFLDLTVDTALVIGGQICQHANPIVRSAYLGFRGDLVFLDTQGSDDPVTTGLGTRYQLLYLDIDEVATAHAGWRDEVDRIAGVR